MPPDDTVTDQIKEEIGGPPAVEQGVGVHGKEEGDDLAVGKTVQPRLVVSIKRTDVNLWKVQRKSMQDKLSFSRLRNVPLRKFLDIIWRSFLQQ